MTETGPANAPPTAVRSRTAVFLYIGLVLVLAAASSALSLTRRTGSFPLDLVAFMALAAITDLREIRLPLVGIVTLSFVPVLAALAVFGLWEALLVAAVSGLATTVFTRSLEKIAFNIGNYLLSTFLAGLLYFALVPHEAGLADKILPLFAATAVDFFANTVVLAGVIALATSDNVLRIWRSNYQWGLPSYMTGASLSLLVAWLYIRLGIPGLLLGLPPLYLIYYSYDIYVARVRDRETHGIEIASFQQDLVASKDLHDQLRTAQLKIAAEIERARRIQADLLPATSPQLPGLEIAQRIEFLGEMGGDYFDYLELGDGRLGLACGDVMGKGLAAALIMAMARSLLHSAATPGRPPEEMLAEVNDGLARDLQGQRLPYFLTMVLAVYDPAGRTFTVAGGGHNPLLIVRDGEIERVPSGGAAMGVRTGLRFPQVVVPARSGDLVAFYTDGITETRGPNGELFGMERLCELLTVNRKRSLADTLAATWDEMTSFRAGGSPSDDATLLLARVV